MIDLGVGKLNRPIESFACDVCPPKYDLHLMHLQCTNHKMAKRIIDKGTKSRSCHNLTFMLSWTLYTALYSVHFLLHILCSRSASYMESKTILWIINTQELCACVVQEHSSTLFPIAFVKTIQQLSLLKVLQLGCIIFAVSLIIQP